MRLPERARIVVIALRRIGDVLLTTPLVRSLRRAYPAARIEMLVFAGTEGILAGNPDIDEVVTLKPRPRVADTWTVLRRIAWRYDLAVSIQPGDRPTVLTFAAARYTAGIVSPSGRGFWWKGRAIRIAVPEGPNHRVIETLRISQALGIEPHCEVVCPQPAPLNAIPGRYAVVHANPMFRYRRWSDQGWHSLAAALVRRGFSIVATGGSDSAERAYLDALWSGSGVPVERLDGKLDWGQLMTLLNRAAVYIGADTSVTHLAAASGCPTVALFGPTDPRLWGPVPAGGLDPVWAAVGAMQRRGNVRLVQHVLPCVPCQREGCERHRESHSACLDWLGSEQVLAAVDEVLGGDSVRDRSTIEA